MTYKQVIEKMLDTRMSKKKDVSKKVGLSGNFLAQLTHRKGDILLGSLLKVCEVLDFEVVVRKKNYLRVVDGEMVLDGQED